MTFKENDLIPLNDPEREAFHINLKNLAEAKILEFVRDEYPNFLECYNLIQQVSAEEEKYNAVENEILSEEKTVLMLSKASLIKPLDETQTQILNLSQERLHGLYRESKALKISTDNLATKLQTELESCDPEYLQKFRDALKQERTRVYTSLYPPISFKLQ